MVVRLAAHILINCKFNWFKFTSADAPSGDINADGVVNVTDVTALGNKILGTASYADSICDLNSDGIINVSDVTTLVNLILNK